MSLHVGAVPRFSTAVVRPREWGCWRKWRSMPCPFSANTPSPNGVLVTSSRLPHGAASVDRHASSTSSALKPFKFRPRLGFSAPFRSTQLSDYIACRGAPDFVAVSIAHTYRHKEQEQLTVTLVPLRHFAHPSFFAQVDALCGQHQSVLMEGRMPLTGAPHSTLVPPREALPLNPRPIDHEDDEGWEPREAEAFFQPFSWGVKDSPAFTVIHAADKYDYECLPWYCSLRFNFPLMGSFAREQHCLGMIPPLYASGYTSFAIPWGAGHMPILHEMLLDNGFERVGMCSLLLCSRNDGDRSEGEFLRLQGMARRRRRWGQLLKGVGVLLVLHVMTHFFEVEYSGRRSKRALRSPSSPSSSCSEGTEERPERDTRDGQS